MKGLFGLIIGVIVLLFGVSAIYLVVASAPEEAGFISPDLIRGSSIIHKGTPYTLNFTQQNALISLLNEGRSMKQRSEELVVSSNIVNQMIFYFFEKPPLIITPLKEDLSILSFSSWPTDEVLKIERTESLRDLLQQTYDGS